MVAVPAIGLAGGGAFILHQLRLGSVAKCDLTSFRIPRFLAAIILRLTLRALSFEVTDALRC